MKYLKVELTDGADAKQIQQLISLVSGVKSAELIDELQTESELKKAFQKGREQLKNGEYESIVNDIFDILTSPKTKQ